MTEQSRNAPNIFQIGILIIGILILIALVFTVFQNNQIKENTKPSSQRAAEAADKIDSVIRQKADDFGVSVSAEQIVIIKEYLSENEIEAGHFKQYTGGANKLLFVSGTKGIGL